MRLKEKKLLKKFAAKKFSAQGAKKVEFSNHNYAKHISQIMLQYDFQSTYDKTISI